MPSNGPIVRVGSTGNRPELIETIPITSRPGRRKKVALCFGPGTRTDSPLPDLLPGDRLLVFGELEVTTDAEDAGHPGRIGNPYSYAPLVEATLLLAADEDAVEAGSRALRLATRWRESVSHRQHHAVVVFEDGEITVPRRGLPWRGPAHVNLVLDASHPDARQGDLLLVGQNEKTPTVVQDMAGIRVVRLRPGDQPVLTAAREATCLVAGIPVAKRETLVFSHRLDDLRKGEQLVIKARLTTDAAQLGYAARISSRLFLADGANQLEPGGGRASRATTWKGQVSKPTGFNCMPQQGARTTLKFGVARVLRDVGGPLFLNMVAVSAAPFGGAGSNDELPVVATDSSIEVTRYPPELDG